MTSASGQSKLAAVILAAGGSSRLGQPKQLLRQRSIPLVLRAVQLAERFAGAGTCVVLGHQHLRLRRLLRRHNPGLVIVNNVRWREGLSTSLRAGLAGVSPRARAALILLVDQPKIGAQDIARLIGRYRARPGRAVAACYSGRAGVPAIVPRNGWRALAAVAGDKGARDFLQTLPANRRVDMPGAALDIDTPADAARMRP